MPQYLHPGVYVEEIAPDVRSIEGVRTSVVAEVGVARDPSDPSDPIGHGGRAQRIACLADLQAVLGRVALDREADYTIRQVFPSGGSAAWVLRVRRVE